jgi:branched-subunit amino acid ABC-type transport system permease component
MQSIFLFIVIGLVPGALIAAVALGLVLTYRGANIINIATGSLAMMGAYAYYGLSEGGYLYGTWLTLGPGPWPPWAALLGALAVSAGLGVALEFVVVRPLRQAAPLTKLLATLGVYLTFGSFIFLSFGADGQSPVSVLGPGLTVRVFEIPIRVEGLILALLVVIVAIALAAVYRFTRFGLATRAAAENDTNATLAGLNVNALSLVNVTVSATLAGLFGVLVAPITGLDPGTIPNVIVPALGAALLAAFTSFSIAVLAGLAMGVASSLLILAQAQTWFPAPGGTALTGVDDVLFFVVIVIALFLRGSSLPRRESLLEKRLPPVPVPVRLMRPAIIVGVISVAYFLLTPYDFRQAGINTFIGVVLALSFVVIIGYVGQSSVLQVALAGVAGFTVSKVAVLAGIGFPLGPILGVLVAVAVGTLVAFSALRVRGVNLFIVTLAAAVALEQFVFRNPTWGGGATGAKVPSPELLGVGIGPDASFLGITGIPSPLFGILIAMVAIAACLFVSSVRRVNLGHRLLAVRSNERAAAAAGIDVRNTKLIAFALSSAIAGTAGVMYAYNFGSVTAGRFSVSIAMSAIAFAYIAGITTVRGAVLSGTMMVGAIGGFLVLERIALPYELLQLVGGIALVLTIVFKPEGIAGGPLKSQTGQPTLWTRLTTRRRPAGVTS